LGKLHFELWNAGARGGGYMVRFPVCG
jgi:hypothetical protein